MSSEKNGFLLSREAEKVSHLLRKTNQKIIFAESCTGGLLASSLCAFPGISSHLIGSYVVYQEWTKTKWLDVNPKILSAHFAVSEPCVRALLEGLLRKNPPADVAIAISGYLGPGNPRDGLIYFGVQWRSDAAPVIVELHLFPRKKTTRDLREKRRVLASTLVFFLVRSLLKQRLYTPLEYTTTKGTDTAWKLKKK